MKKLFDQTLATARAKPVRFTSIVLMLVGLGAIGLALGEPLGWEMVQFTR
jgi:hypothetical protein